MCVLQAAEKQDLRGATWLLVGPGLIPAWPLPLPLSLGGSAPILQHWVRSSSSAGWWGGHKGLFWCPLLPHTLGVPGWQEGEWGRRQRLGLLAGGREYLGPGLTFTIASLHFDSGNCSK